VSRLDVEVEIRLFAFVFAAVVALALALIDEIRDRLQWWRLAAKVGAFGVWLPHARQRQGPGDAILDAGRRRHRAARTG
jgi:hypothetical protein